MSILRVNYELSLSCPFYKFSDKFCTKFNYYGKHFKFSICEKSFYLIFKIDRVMLEEFKISKIVVIFELIEDFYI